MTASLGYVLAQMQRWTSPRLQELSDAVLLDRFVQGRDESAFAALVARHGAMVLRSCRRVLGDAHEAEDAFQATFLVLAQRAHTLRHAAALPGFLHSVAHRVSLKARAKVALSPGNSPLTEETADVRSDPLMQLTARELLTVLDEEIARLPAAQRSALVLCCLEGHTREEAARILGCTDAAIKGHLQRGRLRLQKRLERRGVALSAALAIVIVARDGMAARVPALLLQNTVQAAMQGAIVSSASVLAHSVLHAMFWPKLAGLLAATLTLALAASATIALVYRGSTEEAPEEKTPAVADAAKNSGVEKRPVRTDLWGDPLPLRAVARLGSLRLYHGAQNISQVDLSPDGKWVASTDHGRTNKLWDVQTGREQPLPDHLRHNFTFAANGKLLVAEFGNKRLWDMTTGKEVSAKGIDIDAARKRKEPGPSEILSPDGTILAVWGDDKRIHLLDARTRKELPPLQNQPEERNLGYKPCFSPDGKMLAAPSLNPVPGVRLWDLTTRKEARWLRGKDFQIFDIAFSGDGKIVAAADGNGVTLWDAGTSKWLHDPGHTYAIGALAFTPDGQTLLSGAWYNDRFLRLWDPFTGRPRGKWNAHRSGTYALIVPADGKRVISTGQDRTIRLWDLASGKEISRFGDDKNPPIWSAALSSDGKMLATPGEKGIQLWDVATRRKVRCFGAGTVLNLAFSPDGSKLTSSASKDAVVRLWNVANGQELRSFKCQAHGNPKLDFSPDGRVLAAGDDNGVIHLWDPLTGKELRQFGQPHKPGPGSAFYLGALAFSPDGRVVAAGYSDLTIRLLEVATGKERVCYHGGHRNSIISLAFSPDGRLLASGGWDRTIMVWDVTGRICPDRPGRLLLDAKMQERLWTELADNDAAKAYKAMQMLLAAEQAVDMLRNRLRPAAAVDPARLNRLAAELDSDDFAVREKATRELTEVGDRAEPLLHAALPKASPEARRRIEDILARIDPASAQELQRELRAVEVLELFDTADARQVLKILAEDDPHARLTREAKAALERLQR